MQMCVATRAGTGLFDFGSSGAQGAFDLWRKAISQNQILSIHDKADVIELGISSAATIITSDIQCKKAHAVQFLQSTKSPFVSCFEYTLLSIIFVNTKPRAVGKLLPVLTCSCVTLAWGTKIWESREKSHFIHFVVLIDRQSLRDVLTKSATISAAWFWI